MKQPKKEIISTNVDDCVFDMRRLRPFPCDSYELLIEIRYEVICLQRRGREYGLDFLKRIKEV